MPDSILQKKKKIYAQKMGIYKYIWLGNSNTYHLLLTNYFSIKLRASINEITLNSKINLGHSGILKELLKKK